MPRLGPGRNGRPDAAARVTVFEGALCLGGDSNGSIIHPRRHEHPLAAARSRSLQFKIAIQVVDRSEQRRRHRQPRSLDRSCERSHPVFVVLPTWQGLLRRDQRHHGPRTLLLFRPWESESSALKHAVQRIIIGQRHRIELVVVASGTTQRQTQKGLTHRVDGVLEGQVVVILRVEAEPPRNGQESGGRHAFGIPVPGSLPGQQVPGDLLRNKLKVGFVGIEGIDDVVPIAPGHRHRIVGSLARGVGIPNDIQPMPAPALPVTGRGQQPVDHRFDGIG